HPAFVQIGDAAVNGASVRFGLDGTLGNFFSGFYGGGVKCRSLRGAAFGLYVCVSDSGGGTNTAQPGNYPYWNGNFETTAASLSDVTVNITNGLFRIGQSPVGTGINGDLAEVLVFNGVAFGASARGALEGYLRVKYN